MLTEGASEGLQMTEAELESAKDVYYAMTGWDVATRTPRPETLERVGLARL